MKAADLNAMHRAFWADQTEVLEQRLADPLVDSAVLKQVRSEQLRIPDPYYRNTIEAIAESYDSFARVLLEREAKAERDRIKAASERAADDALHSLASKGGAAKKGDKLKQFIDDRVAENPDISAAQLERELRDGQRSVAFDWLDEVTDTEIYLSGGKVIKISGLKHRLSRAKKDLKRASR